MSGELYCSEADLYDFGLPRGALPNPARMLDSTDAANDRLLLDLHGLSSGQPVSFRAEAGGELPTPLAANTTYYALPIGQNIFQVAATAGGAAIPLTAEGDRVLLIVELPIEAACEFGSRLIDDMLPAHVVPLSAPIAPIIRITAAELAAAKLGYYSGGASGSLAATVDAATKRVARWATGIEVRGQDAPTTHTNKAASGATASQRDSRGWRRFGGL